MAPPAARLRGRRNQMQWLLDQLSERIQDPQAEFAALQPDVHSELLADWEALDAAWQQHDNEAPAFYGLRAALTNLPVERSEEHTSELQSLMRNSYAVFCLTKKKKQRIDIDNEQA